ncbi:MAG TPA: zinc ribbon domain-containing protein [Ktedonobacterales bacterium]|nr:zinc ribbon domain-containing protein [Ktedonobacterales bacterium]
MQCWNCGASAPRDAEECPRCGAELSLPPGEWDDSMPQPVRRPDAPRRRDDDRDGRSSRAPRDPRGARGGRSGARDDRDDRDRRASRSDRPARDDFDDERADAPRSSRGSRSGSPSRSGRAPDDDERGGRDAARDGSARRSHGLPDDRSGRGDRAGRYKEPEPSGYTDDSLAIPALTDDSIEAIALTDDSIEAQAYARDRDHRDLRDPRDRRDSPSRGRAPDDDARRDGYDGYDDRPGRSNPGRESRDGRGSRGGRGDPRDPRLPDPLDDPRAPRALRYGDPRDPRDPRGSARYPDGPGGRDPRDPRMSGGSGSGGRSRSRADYGDDPRMSGPSAPGGPRRDPRDPRAADVSGGRGAMGPGFGPGAANGGRPMPGDAWAPPGGPLAVAPNPRGLAPGGAAGAPTKKAPNRQRQIALVLIIILGLAAVGGLGYHFAPASIKSKVHHLLGSSPSVSAPTVPPFATYTPGPTPTPLANDKINVSAPLHYVIDYPSAWLLGSNSTTTSGQYDNLDTYSQPSADTRITVETAGAFASYTPAQIIQGEITAATQQGATFSQIASATRTQSVGGEVWQRQEYTVTLKITPTATATATATPTTAHLHMAILATHHLGRGYVIVLTSDDTAFTKADTTYFEPTLSTFRFS